MGIGAIAGIVGSVVGGIGNYFATKSANEAAAKQAKLARQHELNILQNQVGWRVKDAMKAGLHPLAALGLNPASSSVGAAQVFPNTTDYAAMGADLGRALESSSRPEAQIAARATQLSFEKTALENEYVKTQIASQRMRNIQQAAPGVPTTDPAINGSIALPGTKYRMPQEHPNLAQTAEIAYGEIGGELFGMSNLAVDAYRYMGLERVLMGDDITPAIPNLMQYMYGPSSGSASPTAEPQFYNQ